MRIMGKLSPNTINQAVSPTFTVTVFHQCFLTVIEKYPFSKPSYIFDTSLSPAQMVLSFKDWDETIGICKPY